MCLETTAKISNAKRVFMQSNNEIAHQLVSSSSRCTMCTTSGTKDLQGIEAPSADTKCEFACFCRKCCVFVVMVEPFVKKKDAKIFTSSPIPGNLGLAEVPLCRGFPPCFFWTGSRGLRLSTFWNVSTFRRQSLEQCNHRVCFFF